MPFASLALLILLAGCLGEEADPADGTAEGAEADSAIEFEAPTLVGAGGSSLGETSLDVGPDGTMIVCAVSTHEVWTSEDGGRTWRAHAPFGTVRNGDCDVAVSPEGHWHVVFARWSGPAGTEDLSLAVSRDRGATWEEHPLTPPIPLHRHCPVPPYGGCFAHRPWLHAVNGSLLLTYSNILPTASFFQRSDDGGATWSDPVRIALDARVGLAGDMVVGEGGRTIHVPLVRKVPAGADGERVGIEDELRPWLAWYEVATSTDGGASWTTRQVAGPLEARFAIPSAGRAASGELYYAIPLANGSTVDLAVSVSGDGGETWSSPNLIAPGVEMRPGLAYVALDPSPHGGVVAAWTRWIDQGSSTGWALQAAKLDARAEDLVRWTTDATAPAGGPGTIEFFELRHDPQGRIHVAYPIPEAPCPGGTHRDCIHHVAQRTPAPESV